jgi:hypothetical protein
MAVHKAFKECSARDTCKGPSFTGVGKKRQKIVKCDAARPKDAGQKDPGECKAPCSCRVFRRAVKAKADVDWDYVIPDANGEIEKLADFDYECFCVQLELPTSHKHDAGTCERPKLLDKSTKIYCPPGKCTGLMATCELFRIKHDGGKGQQIADASAKWEWVQATLQDAAKYDDAYYYECSCTTA